jgi:hypothetical protein
MLDEKINLLEAQCFFRHLAGHQRFNDSVKGLSPALQSVYQKITFYHGKVPDDIQKISLNILQQIQKLTIRLIPLCQIGLKYDIYIAGGCLRDLLLGNHNNIKDVDVIFCLDSESVLSTVKNTPLFTLEAIFGEDIIQYTNWINSSDVKKIHGLFHYCLNKNYSITRGYNIEDMKEKNATKEYGSILNENLEGIITIESKDDTYPMDVILTTSVIDVYLKSFNFEICKVYIPFFTYSNGRFINNIMDFLEQVHVKSGFMDDVHNKTITYYMDSVKSIEMIERSISHHLPRITAKYPSYKLILNASKNTEYVQWKAKYEDYIVLNKELPHKVDVSIDSAPRSKILKV